MTVDLIEPETRKPAAEQATNRFAVPWDISEWIDKSELQSWVKAEIDVFDWNDPRLRGLLERHPDFQPRELLALCVYAYALGTLESEEISFQCVRGSALHGIGGRSMHSARDISRFRRNNRGLIRYVLTQVLKRAARQRFGFGLLLPAGLRRMLEQNASERIELARHMDRAADGG